MNLTINPLIQFLEPMGFIDYNALQSNAYIVLSDSGTISEESSILNFRALNIREAHERPEAMEEASVMMAGVHKENIFRGIEEVISQQIGSQRDFNLVSDYSNPNVSSKVVRIILSYTSYVNRVVWQKINKKRLLIYSLVFSPDGVSTAYLYNDIAQGFQKKL